MTDMSTSPRHLVIMAAGTGGHIMPGLAVADEMKRRGWTVSWLGTQGGMENRLVPPAGIPLDTISFSGLRGKGAKGALLGGFKLLKGFAECARILKTRQATAVLGMGGYVCFPGGLMAKARGLPLVMVNADAALLLSNKALLPLTNVLACGFDGPAARHKVSRVTGNPVRAEIEAIAPPAERFAGRTGPLRVLIVGGSLGARVLNEQVPPAVAAAGVPIAVRHQCGKGNRETVAQAYAELGVEAEVSEFIKDMADAYAWADLVVCRAGALTVSEVAAAGVAAIFVPLPHAVDDHQTRNALTLVDGGAAEFLPQSELTPASLAARLSWLAGRRETLLNMAQAARRVAIIDAAERVADECKRLASGQSEKAC